MSEKRYSENPLIRGAEVINYFQQQGRDLTEKEIERAIIDNDYARELVKSGRLTSKERGRLRAQAQENLRSREALSELKNLGYAQEYDVTADAALENDNEDLNSKKQSDYQRYLRNEQYLTGEGTTPGIRGDIDARLERIIQDRRTKIKEDRYRKPDGIIRQVYEPAKSGFDYENITQAPASGGRGSAVQQILGATRASDAARAERKAMQDEVKKIIAADNSRLTDAGRQKRDLNNLIAAIAAGRESDRMPVNRVLSNPSSLFGAPPVTAQAVEMVSTKPPFLAPGGGVVGYADQGLNEFLGVESDNSYGVNRLGKITTRELAAMSTPAYISQFGGMGAQQFIDNFSMPNEFGKQVAIDAPLELTNFVQRLRQTAGQNVLPTTFSDIRSASDLDDAVKNAISSITAKNEKLYLPKPKAGTRQAQNIFVRPNEAGVLEVLNKMDYDDSEKRYLAMALNQIQQARSNKVNAAQKYAYLTRQPIQGPRRANFYTGAGETIDEMMGRSSRIDLQQDSKMRVDGDASIGALPTDKPASQQNSLLRRGPFYNSKTGELRGPIKTREHNMASLNAKRQKQENTANPMTRDDYVAGVQDIREKQVQNYVTQVRASRDRKRRAEAASEIISAMPPAGRRSRYPRGSEVRDTNEQKERALPRSIPFSQLSDDELKNPGMNLAEPTVPGSVGYGDDMRQVQQAAKDQSSDMVLSELIRRQRLRRGA